MTLLLGRALRRSTLYLLQRTCRLLRVHGSKSKRSFLRFAENPRSFRIFAGARRQGTRYDHYATKLPKPFCSKI
jgi:hypothetical protein